MANLELIDEIVNEVSKVRGIDLPPVCLKILLLTYWMYCVNTYDVKYHNEFLGMTMRLNSGCIILCQKGTGKSLSLKIFREIFSKVEEERSRRFEESREMKIGRYERAMIPLTNEQKKEIDDFYLEHGNSVVEIFEDTTTAKNLCDAYAKSKKYSVNNILFNIDEAGDRIFKEAFSKNPSVSSKEFVGAINQLFDGYCGMGQSKASKNEGISSQSGVGANFIFASTAEFLKDYHVQQRYESSFEGGFARRLLFVNCPPIDPLKTSRKFYKPDITNFKKIATSMVDNLPRGLEMTFTQEVKDILEKEGIWGTNIDIPTEFLLLTFCTALAAWTGDTQIQVKHWDYMMQVHKGIKALSMDVVKEDTTNYDRICVFVREYLEKNKTKKKVPIALVKDFCWRNKMCFGSKFNAWFRELRNDFGEANSSKYILEKNQFYVWIAENFAFGED